MRCYSVLLEAKLSYHFLSKGEDEEEPVRGYFVTHYVLARDGDNAFERAQRSERRLIENEWSGIRDGSISVSFNLDEIQIAPLWRLLSGRCGRAYYETD